MVPLARTSTTQHHAFSVFGPSTWNNLLSDLQDLLARDSVHNDAYTFHNHLRSAVNCQNWAGSALEVILEGCYISFLNE